MATIILHLSCLSRRNREEAGQLEMRFGRHWKIVNDTELGGLPYLPCSRLFVSLAFGRSLTTNSSRSMFGTRRRRRASKFDALALLSKRIIQLELTLPALINGS